MSINTGEGMGMSTDYGDFRYQTVDYEHQFSVNSAGNVRGETATSIEPLQDRGGLEVNELAELAYLETYAVLEHEMENGEQTEASTVEFRGVVGIDIPSVDGTLQRGSLGQESVLEEPDINVNDRDGDSRVVLNSFSDDRVLQLFKSHDHVSFDELSNGAGGGGSTTLFQAEKNWRSLTGRGPIVDSNDDITINSVIAGDDLSHEVIGNVRLHMVWDISETDTSGRRFSVPE